MNTWQSWLNTFLAAAGPALLLWRLARTERKAVEAAQRAEQAARDAATHAKTISDVDAKLGVLVEQTNGMSHRLEQLAGEAGELRGREAEKKEERG